MISPGGGLSSETRTVLGHYWRIAEVRPWQILFPMVLAILVSLAEGASFSVLIPLSDGVAAGTFEALEGSQWVGWVGGLLPESLGFSPGRDTYIALGLVCFLFGGQFLKLALEYGRAWFLSGRDERYLTGVKEETFGRVLGFGRQYFDQKALGHVDTEISWSASLVEFLSALEGLVMDLLRLLVKVALVVVISLPLSLSLVVSLSLVHLFHRRLSAKAGALAEDGARIQKRIRKEVLDLLSTIPLVKSYAQEEEARANYGEILDAAESTEVSRRRLLHFHHPVEEGVILFFAFLTEGLLLIFAPGPPAAHLARFCAFFLVAQQCVPDLKAITKFRLAIINEIPKLDSLGRLLQADDKFIIPSGIRPFSGIEKEIELRSLSYGYDPGKPVLRDLDAVFPAGHVTGVVGQSGAGKSTLASLVARLYDIDPGGILLDGVDIREFDLRTLRRKLAIVSQDVWLLNRTLRENLTFGLSGEVSDESLWSVLAEMELRAFFEGQPDGLDTELGDRGVLLSGGQRQRVAVARTLLRDPEILILDEATAALDSTIENKVMEAVQRRLHGRTIIIIAHRLSTIKGADQILVMESGRIVERGAWSELVRAGGAFSVLHRDQFKDGASAE